MICYHNLYTKLLYFVQWQTEPNRNTIRTVDCKFIRSEKNMRNINYPAVRVEEDNEQSTSQSFGAWSGMARVVSKSYIGRVILNLIYLFWKSFLNIKYKTPQSIQLFYFVFIYVWTFNVFITSFIWNVKIIDFTKTKIIIIVKCYLDNK